MDAVSLIRTTIENELSKEHLMLPVPDYVAGCLNRLLHDDGVDFDELSGIIARDPSLMAKILNVSNSSFYSGLVRIRTVDQAIARIGLRAVKNLLMTVVFKSVFRTEQSFLRNEFETNWLHALGCGMCARRLAEKTSFAFLADDAYLLGLLHDIGTVFILHIASHLYRQEGMAHWSEDSIMSVVAMLHAETGARILAKLGFNPLMCTLISLHHEPERFDNQNDTLFNILQISDRLLGRTGIALASESRLCTDDAPWMARLNIAEQTVADLESSLAELLTTTDGMI